MERLQRLGRCAVAIACGLHLAGAAGATEIPFDDHVLPIVFPAATAAVATDFDGDGDLDVMMTSEDGDVVRWAIDSDGAGSYGFPQSAAAVEAPVDLAAGDLDGDGDVDAVVVSFANFGSLVWLENDGSPASGLWPDHAIADRITPVALDLADLDGDGDLDVVAASSLDDGIAWHQSDGAAVPSFTLRWVTRDTDGLGGVQGDCDPAADVVAADLDGDGDLDLLTACHGNDRVAWHENTDGAGSFGPQQVLHSTLDGARHVHAADLDLDGDLDVLASGLLDGKVIRLLQTAPGVFAGAELVAVHTGAATLDAADPDRDGDVDVLMGHEDGVRWREHAGDLGFRTLGVDLFPDGGARAARWQDLDRDGDLDVLVARYDGERVVWYENLTIHSSARFPAVPTDLAARGSIDALASGDLDGDGDLDLVAGSWLLAPQDPQGTWLLWNENTGGGFAPQERLADVFDQAQAIELGDLDGDGDLDVLVSTSGILGAVLEWWENEGGTFAVDHRIAGAEVWPDVELTDLDRDGDLDVVAAQRDFVAAVWFENIDGEGTFGAAQTVWERQSTSSADTIAVADFDGDGDADVAAAGGVGPIVWLPFEGGGFGAERAIFSPESNGTPLLASGDLDGDGWSDLVAFTAARGVHWFRNLHGGSFAAPVHLGTFPTLPSPAALEVLDLDHDGDLDLLAADRSDARVAWLENLGGAGPAFDVHLLLDQGSGAVRGVAAGDFDGDGDLDVAYGGNAALDLGWWPNQGGQYSLQPTNVAQQWRGPGVVHELFRLDFEHLGRNGDAVAEMVEHVLLIEKDEGVFASAADIAAAFSDFAVWLDDGDGVFETAADFRLATPWHVAGSETRLGLNGASFESQEEASVWVTGTVEAAGPPALRLTYRSSRNRFEHPESAIPLRAATIPDATTGWLTRDPVAGCRGPYELELFDFALREVTLTCVAGTRLSARNVAVDEGALLTLRAGRSLALGDGFAVGIGGRLRVEVDPGLDPGD